MSSINYIFIAFLCLSQFAAASQELISADLAISLSKGIIQLNLGEEVENDVVAYRILYSTTDIEGRLDTASGLLVLPDNIEGPFPQLIYQHGTVNGRLDVPSELAGGWELALGIASFGFVTITPDFQGLGTSRGIHPYVHADSEALAATDMLIAVQSFLSENAIEVTDKLFVTGYSQGGHAAMAAHRALERDFSNQFEVTASAPMSGPYNISGAMIDFTLSDEEYNFVGYLAWTTLSYQRAYPDLMPNLETIFKEKYITSIQQFAREEIGLGDLNQQLRSLILEDSDIVQPKLLFTDEILSIIINGDDHPINDAFKENDLHNWLPVAPIRMLYCGMDEQVTFQNALIAESTMIELGAPDVAAVLIDENRNHGSCVIPASLYMVEYFKGFLDSTSPVNDALLPSEEFKLSPNPASDEIRIDYPSHLIPDRITVISPMGQTIHTFKAKGLQQITVSQLESGLYFLRIEIGNQYVIKPLMISQ